MFNLVYIIFGGLVLYSGVNTNGQEYQNIGIVMAGIASVFLGICGCCGAFFKSKGPLIIYSTLLIILVVSQCVLGTMTMIASGDHEFVEKSASSTWDSMSNEDKNSFQAANYCCGYSSMVDRQGSLCTQFDSCREDLNNSVRLLLKSLGLYMFVGAGCEVITVSIALILAFSDDRKDKKIYRKH